jgi:hypothetical protein
MFSRPVGDANATVAGVAFPPFCMLPKRRRLQMVHIVCVAEIGALVGDPARANMLEALMDPPGARHHAGEGAGFPESLGVEPVG